MIRRGPRRSAVVQAVLLGVIGFMLAVGLRVVAGVASIDTGAPGPAERPRGGVAELATGLQPPNVVHGLAPTRPPAASPAAAAAGRSGLFELSADDPALELGPAALEPFATSRADGAGDEGGSTVARGGRPDPVAAQSAAPPVAVRIGKHPGFARIVFDWPETIAYEVLRQGGQVIIAFDRPGRIDLTGLGEQLGIQARSDGAISRRVFLRIAPAAEIRSFSLDGDRVVVDVLGGTAPPDPARAPAVATDEVAELRQVVREREAVIEDLLARVSRLEQRPVLAGVDLDRVTAGQSGDPLGLAHAPAAASSAPAQTASAGEDHGARAAPAAPGSFEVDEKEIDRALERTLVQTGVLLLPFGQAEIEPAFSYTRQETDSPTFVTNDGATFIGEQKVRRNEYEVGVDLRLGLPFDAQFEVGMPYRFVDQSTATEIGFNTLEGTDGSGSGVGDLSVGVAKTLLRERNWWPDLVGRITWDTDTGKTEDNDVVLGSGFNELRGSLSAVKRQDPLAFTAGLSYQKTFENDNVEPGDEYGFALGAALAASADTSLHVAFDQRFSNDVKVDGKSVNGSDSVIGTASVGASVILDHGTLLDVTFDVGLTEDAPDYAVRVSLPIRFDLPTL
jgi:hypothetical protein